jgi:hypothetical protein
MREPRGHWRCGVTGGYHENVRSNRGKLAPVAIGIAGFTMLLICLHPAVALADSLQPSWTSLTTPKCRTAMPKSCELKHHLNVGSASHWDSSIRLNNGGEDIQLQIQRAVGSNLRQNFMRGPLVPWPTADPDAPNFGEQDQSWSSQLGDLFVTAARRVMLSNRSWRRKTTPRCRNNPAAPGCS